LQGSSEGRGVVDPRERAAELVADLLSFDHPAVEVGSEFRNHVLLAQADSIHYGLSLFQNGSVIKTRTR